MGIFASGGRRGRPAAAPRSAGRAGNVGFPRGFEAVGEALLAEECPLAACDAVGREMALDGASASEALSGLHATWDEACSAAPSFEATQALVVAWSETTLSAMNHVSCDDPMTGLSSTAHLSSVLRAVFRRHRLGAAHPRDSHALVVVDLPGEMTETSDSIGRALRVARLGDAVRTVFAGDEVIARVNPQRLVVLVHRDSRLGVRVRLVRRLVDGMQLGAASPRVWIEGLPSSEVACGFLLDEMTRP